MGRPQRCHACRNSLRGDPLLTVIILISVPAGLRGHLTRWLLEVSPGVFVGHISARVRGLIWQRITEFDLPGKAVMVNTARTEQHLAFQVHGHDWPTVDFDGISLVRRPNRGRRIDPAGQVDDTTPRHPKLK